MKYRAMLFTQSASWRKYGFWINGVEFSRSWKTNKIESWSFISPYYYISGSWVGEDYHSFWWD